jgi:hypothetical protein
MSDRRLISSQTPVGTRYDAEEPMLELTAHYNQLIDPVRPTSIIAKRYNYRSQCRER